MQTPRKNDSSHPAALRPTSSTSRSQSTSIRVPHSHCIFRVLQFYSSENYIILLGTTTSCDRSHPFAPNRNQHQPWLWNVTIRIHIIPSLFKRNCLQFSWSIIINEYCASICVKIQWILFMRCNKNINRRILWWLCFYTLMYFYN